jgi:hypothetical protein
MDVEVLARRLLVVPVVAAGDQEVDDEHAHREREDDGDDRPNLLQGVSHA